MNIRVLREAGGVGDVVRILSAIRGLREKYPDARIDVFVPRYYRGIVERGGDASNIYNAPCVEGKRRSRLAPADEERWAYMKTNVSYDLTVDLYCPAFAHELRAGRAVYADRIELFCEAAGVRPSSYTPSMTIAAKEQDAARKMLLERGIAEGKGWIVIQPFCTDGGRDWPAAHWKALADALCNAGYGVMALDSAKRVRDFPCSRITGLSLMRVAEVLSVARLVIGPDSGMLHLAGAVGTQGIGLTAGQSGGVLYRHYPRHTYIQPSDEMVCDWPCYWQRGRVCARQAYARRRDTCYALRTLSPATVVEAVLDYLERGGADACRLPSRPPRRPSGTVDGPAPVFPARDRTVERAEFRRYPGGTTVGEWLWEYFRVLKVGGELTVVRELLDGRKRLPGLVLVGESTTELTYRKAATWPDWRLS